MKNKGSNFLRRSIFIFLMIFQFLNVSVFAQEADTQPKTESEASQNTVSENEVTTITITNARQTDYKKNEETGNDSIVLEGSVEISVQKGNTVSNIKADKIIYDRVTKMLFAQGNVEITTKSSSEGGETTKASSLLMNSSTLEGVFEDGRVIQTQSDALNLPSGSTLIVYSDIFGKSESNTIAFKNSKLTFCDDDDPHWHIDATRTWLLPGGEFAFFNAVLYVGIVPVMYFPAFYYPKDELVFNPVFGYRKREGYYVQTTTYLYGRKSLAESSSSSADSSDKNKALYNFMKPNSLKKQELQGIVLHNLDENYTGDTENFFKIDADLYSNLGGMIGAQGKFSPKNEYVSSVNFDLLFAFSNTVYNNGSLYTPLDSSMQTNSESSHFLGLDLPFRYSANLDLSIVKPFSLSVSLPVYSDPSFYKDFMNRRESMDWISYLTTSEDSKDSELSEISSLIWKLNASYSIPISDSLRPYISNANVSLSSSLNLSSRTDSSKNYYSSEYKFYYPSLITPVSANASISGQFFKWPREDKKVTPQQFEVQLNKPQMLLTDKEKEDLNKKEETASEKQKEVKIEEQTEKPENNLKPELRNIQNNSYSVKDITGLVYSLDYSIQPDFINQIAYDASSVPTASDFDWSDIKSSMYTIKVPVSLSSSLNYANNFITMNNRLSYTPVFQDHPDLNGYDEQNRKSITYADYTAQSQSIVSSNTVGFKPFVYLKPFSETGISWNTTFKLFQRKFTGDSSDPMWQENWPDAWKNQYLDWSDSDTVTENTLNFNLSANQDNNRFRQTLLISTTLSPQDPKVNASLNLTFPYVTAAFAYGASQVSQTDTTWKKNPFTQSVSVSLFDSTLSFSESFSYNVEENYADSLRFNCTYKSFQTSFVMAYTTDYDFDSSSGWIPLTDKAFIPYSLSFTYSPKTTTFYHWFDRISIAPSLNTSLVADLVRPTNSYFVFTPGLTFKINEFLNISFSATSKNSVLYRYIQPLLGQSGRLPGEENIFVDLLDSFDFFDNDKRKSSGFKLKSLNLQIDHDLHDWNFSMLLKFEPRLVTKNGQKYYDYNPYFSLGITWKPMESIKTQITDEYGTLQLE